MGASGSKSVIAYKYSSGGTGAHLKFSWWESYQSIERNYTTVGWKLELISYEYGANTGATNQEGAVNLNGGSNIVHSTTVGIGNNQTKTLASGYKDITHNADGTKTFNYSFYQDFNIYFNGNIGRISGSGSGTLTAIPRQATILTAPNFKDTDNPTITYSNPAGNSVSSLRACISFTGAQADIPYRDISKTGSSYTFNLTDSERNALRSATIGVRSINMIFYVTSVIGGTTYYSTLTRTLTIADQPPTYNTGYPKVSDYGSASYALTHNRDVLIKGFNYPRVSFGATAYKSATINSKSAKCLGKNYTPSIYTADGVTWDGYFENVESGTFNFSVTDSRGLTTTKNITKTVIDYFKPTVNVTTTTTISGINAFVMMNISGKLFNDIFGEDGEQNEHRVYWRYKRNNYSYSSWYNISTTVSGNTYSKSQLIGETPQGGAFTPTQFGLGDIITLQVIVGDSVCTSYYDRSTKEPKSDAILLEKRIAIQPIFDWGSSDFKFNVPVYFDNGKTLIDTIYPVGSIYMSVNSVDPTTLFGGTWERIKDRFLLSAGDTYSSGNTGGEATHTLTIGEMPKHTHKEFFGNSGGPVEPTDPDDVGWPNATAIKKTWQATYSPGTETGGGGAHNNMPPYLVVNIWKRTA